MMCVWTTLCTLRSLSFCLCCFRTGQAVTGLLRSLRLNFHVHEGSGKLKVTAQAIKNWLQPKTKKLPLLQINSISQPTSLGNQMKQQQRIMRYMDSSMWSNLSGPRSHNNKNNNTAHLLPQHLSHLPTNEKDAHMQHLVSNGVVHTLETMNPSEMIVIPSAKVVST